MQSQYSDMPTTQRYQQIVDMCMRRYTWELLDREEFGRRVSRRLDSEPDLDLRYVVMQVYVAALHHACSGAEGRTRQERGYRELLAYLSACAARRYPEISADVVQRALELIYRTFDRCRQPDTFLAFALQKLRDAGRAELRLARQEIQSLDMLDSEDRGYAGTQPLAIQEPDPAEALVRHELRQQVAQCGREFLQRHPRAVQQLAVLWLKYIEGLDDREIGMRLGKPLSSIYVLRVRGLAKLRSDSSWRALASELGLEQASAPAAVPIA